MSIQPKRYLACLTALAAALALSAAALADVTGRPHDLSLENPQGHCLNCHDLHQVGIGAGFSFNLKRPNEITVCYQCHAGVMNDYSSIDPSLEDYTVLLSNYDIRSEFEAAHIHYPGGAGMDGERNRCSDCHNPHGVFDSTSTTRLPKLLSAGPDTVTDTDEFCFVCHNNDASPPHAPFANISVGSQYRFSRNVYNQMTHSTFFRATTITEPVPDTARTYDDNPFGKAKDISCLTCHRPHGSAYEFMLKGADDQDFCLACHNGSRAASLGRFTTSGHGKAGVDRICQECHFPHGTGQENSVNKTITDPHTGTPTAVNTNSLGMNDACFACHNQPSQMDWTANSVYSNKFDTSVFDWSYVVVSRSLDNTVFHDSPGSMKITNGSAGDRYVYIPYPYIAVQPNTQYTFAAYLYLPATLTGSGTALRVIERNSSDAVNADKAGTWDTTTGGNWMLRSFTFTTGATTVKVELRLNLNSTGTAYYDEAVLARTDYIQGYFPGKTAYNAGAHKTSPGAVNPADTDPDPGKDDAAGDCANCHDVHGTAGNYAKMLQGADDETLCYICHNASTPNTASGRDVQASFAKASRHDLSAVKCVDCHNVHRATSSSVMADPHSPNIVITNNETFCLKCHSGSMPEGVTGAPDISREWPGGGHDGALMLCSDCHSSHGSDNPNKLLNSSAKVYGGYTAAFTPSVHFGQNEFCLLCHNRTGYGYKNAKKIPTGAGYVAQHEQGAADPCTNCHTKKHDPRLANYTGSSTYYTTACLNCHMLGVGNPLPYADTDFNTPADPGDADVYASIHNVTYSPPSSVDCVNCHGAKHETDHTDSSRVIDPDAANYVAGSLNISTSNRFCLECHDATPVALAGMSPANIDASWTSGGHNDGQLLCSDCHEYHRSMNTRLLRTAPVAFGGYTAGFSLGLSPATRAYCELCHNRTATGFKGADVIPVGSAYVAQHAQADPTPCSSCHSDMHNPRLGAGYYTIACIRCHTQGAGNPLPEADAQFNTPTSISDPDTMGSIHDITYDPSGGTVDCVKCHGSTHESDHSDSARVVDPDTGHPPVASIYASNTFCLDCHDSTPITMAGKAPLNILDTYTTAGHGERSAGVLCSTCHEYHGSANAKLLRQNISGRPVTAQYSGVNVSVCAACHYGKDAALPQWPGFSVYSGSVHAFGNRSTGNLVTDGRHGPGACDNCHNPHGVRDGGHAVRHMLYKEEEENCYTCHNEATPNTMSGHDVKAAFTQTASHHNISDADQLGPDGQPGTADDSKIECYDCHDPHTVTQKLMAYKNVSGAVVPIPADQDFCIKCHDGSPPEGVLYPEHGVWDKSKYTSSAHGNHLKRSRTFSNYSNGVTYPCKLCHDPHGSDQKAQQRNYFDIDRDGIPDDIDGDGVLDSPDMVGYVGYSGCSGRPIYVNSTTGRPDSSCFKRISSTVPYQANGSIDVEMCLNCHDGTPAPDVETDFNKRSHHDVTYADQVASGGSYIECYHCHDQHTAQSTYSSINEFATTNPYPPREPMPSDAPFCLRCHDLTLPPGLSFGNQSFKNIKLSYNPTNRLDARGYDMLTSFTGHFVQDTGRPMMCRECHNQHGSDYEYHIKDNTESSKPGYDPAQPIHEVQPLALRTADPFGGGDDEPLSTTAERCLACHSGVTTHEGSLIPLPPPPDDRGFSLPPVGKHPDLITGISLANGSETGGHLYSNVFAVITTPGSVKETCVGCHDSHNPYIETLGGELMACYQCHNANTHLPDSQSEFNDNPLDPAHSASIHPVRYDPTGNTPAYVECLKCHDQSRHMQGKVRLRKDPTRFDNYTADSHVWVVTDADKSAINSFCTECHGPASAVAASFWKGGSEHVPPRLPSGYTSGAHFANGGLLCTDCHEYHASTSGGLKKKSLAGEEEGFCYNCHADPAKSMSGVDVQAQFATTASHHQVGTAEQAKSGSKVECTGCHNPHSVTRAKPVVHADDPATAVAVTDSFCLGCHDSSGAAGVKFPGFALGTSGPEWNTSTGAWNRWNKAAYSSSAHGGQGIGCAGCHSAHGGANYALLLSNISTATGISVTFGKHSTVRGKRYEEVGVNSVCYACHKDAMGLYMGESGYKAQTFGTAKVDKNCSYCHNPHGTSRPKLIRSDKPLMMNMTSGSFGSVYNFQGFSSPDTGKPYYTFCSSRSCHKSTAEGSRFDVFVLADGGSDGLTVDNFSKDETAPSHHPIKDGTIGCLSCHKEHGSSGTYEQPDLRANYWRQDRWPQTWHSGSGIYAGPSPRTTTYRPHGYTSDYKYNYDPSTFDGRNYYEYPNGNWSKLINPSTPSYANDLCFGCHNKNDIIGTTSGGMTGSNTNFRGHEAVVGGATISQEISYKGNGVGSDYHKFSCSTCHYSHSSRKGKLLRHSCFSQNDGKTIYDNYYSQQYSSASMFNCHPYRSWGSGDYYNRGWRVQTMSPAKTDFKRPPNPVSNLTATVNAALDIRLDWSAVADQPGQGAHHYDVYKHTAEITQTTKPSATRVASGLTGGAPGSAMTWSDYTGQPNTTYYYVVVACDQENNESFISNCAVAALGPDTVGPAAVPNQSLLQPDGTTSVVLTWSDPGDNVNVTQYKVFRKESSVPLSAPDLIEANRIGTVSDTSLSSDGSADSNTYTYTDTTAVMGTCYGYAVAALDAAGNISPPPAAGTRTHCIVDPPPGAVTNLTVRPVTKAIQNALSWGAAANVGSVRGYYVYRKAGLPITQTDIDQGATYRVSGLLAATSWTDTGVPLTAKDYYYAVTAVDDSSGQESKLGNSVYMIIPTPPSAVSAAKLTGSRLYVTWTPPSDVTGLSYYRLYRRKDGGAWSQIATPSASSYTSDMTGQEPGSYDFYVSAYYGTYGGTTPYETMDSNVVSAAVTDTSPPAAITAAAALTAASSYRSARVSWTAPADANYSGHTPSGVDHYKVQKSYNDGSWETVMSTLLTNAGFETHSGTADDTTIDTFTGWTFTNTYAFAVTDAFCDSRAALIRYDGDGDMYITAAEAATGQSVANKAYSMSFWARANKQTTFQFFIQENGGGWQSVDAKVLAVGPEWKYYTASGSFNAFATATSARVVIRPSTDTTAEITIDAVRMMSGSGALSPDDGSFYRPAGYDVPGTALYFDDPAVLPDGGNSARYRVTALDAAYNPTAASTTGYVRSRPTSVTDLFVYSSSDESANVLLFGPSSSLAGLTHYNIYAKKKSTPLTSGELVAENLAATVAPSVTTGNIATSATASASHQYSTTYAATKANDNNTSTRWDGQDNVGPNWLKLTFPSQRALTGVSFNFYNSNSYRPQDYLIQTWDGSAWVTRATVTGNTSNTPSYTFSPPVLTDQVRIYITKTYNTTFSYRPIIYEFYAYGAESYIHDVFNASVPAEPGCTFAYAVVPQDTAGQKAAISTGTSTVNTVPDYEPPAKITDLKLTSPVGTNQVVLKWTKPLDNNGIGCTQASEYEIYQMPVNLIDTPVPVTAANMASALKVKTGTYAFGNYTCTYTATWYDRADVYYAVRSADESGYWSALSNSPLITVGKDMEPPEPPVIIYCIPGPSPEVDVHWTPATDNVGINGYMLYRADADTAPFLLDGCITENNVGQAVVAKPLIAYDATAVTDSGGTPGKRYYYALVAWDHEDNMSNISNCGEATVRTVSTDTTPPTWPGPTPLTALQQPYPDIDLTWTQATDLDDSGGQGAIDHYSIYRSESSFSAVTDPGVTLMGMVSGIRNSYIDDTGAPQTAYYYAVVAYDASASQNAGAMSNVATATVLPAPSPDNTPPSAAAGLSASTGVYPYINLSWTASSDVDDGGNPKALLCYRLYRSQPPADADRNSPDVFVVPNDSTSYTVTGIGSGTAYNFRIEAVDLAGNVSDLSNQATASLAAAPCTDTTAPYAPSGLTAVVGPSPDVELSWSESTDNGGGCSGLIDHYDLYRAAYEITASTVLSTITPIRVAGNNTSFTDSTGEPNTRYWYVMTAVDTSGNESGMSNIITRMTAADDMPPAAVRDLKAAAVVADPGPPAVYKIHLTWCRPSDNIGIDHYEIYRRPQSTILTDGDLIPDNRIEAGFTNAGVCLSYDDTGVFSGLTYSYAVIAVDGAGNRSTISSGRTSGDTYKQVP